MKLLNFFTVLVFLMISACGSDSDEKSIVDVGGRWVCQIEKQYECTRDSCTPRKPPLKLIIDFDTGEYKRCTGSLCDTYPFHLDEDILRSVWVGRIDQARGAYFVVDNDGSNFVESTSQGVWTISSFGNCGEEEVAPPKKK